ncbi:hypothetical protein GGI25_004693 [Coemansia spiralis]|uniref:MARVEL domain-containing protein n=2 Tax=Coemansia TaxID=4863 RepID=A0A9W8G5K7_9FUNG|nr:hypothetical protein BX070DRAFT_235464 [Coemansia spiralis]KAJ1989764.1 hypothetical protein EDC05_004464 [Coemansia umbellata]KAJ2621370.1 hypothetical protein GGI26_004152 [Coemansia sp. RSA 1358]KAJ2673431.1 hypothetical protein GGI25_004693 [Coemansia spiralis]
MFSDTLLKILRFYLYITALVFVVIVLITDAVSLSKLDKYPSGYVSEHKGAAGYTMFVTLASLILIPLITFGHHLAVFAVLSRVLHELILNAVLAVFWFVAGCVMANYSGGGGCYGSSLCSSFRAATAFSWLTFFVLLAQIVFLVLVVMRVRRNNGDIRAPYGYDSGYGGNAGGAAAPPMHSEEPYYETQPKVEMPTPH